MEILGFKIIREMSNEELIEEILTDQKNRLVDQSRTELLKTVVGLRMGRFQEQILLEAGLKVSGLLGVIVENEEDQ